MQEGRAHHPGPDPDLEVLLAEAGWVRDLARRLARDPASADDVAQETLALALERRPAVRGGLRPWLAHVAARFAARQRRAEARRAAREAAVAAEGRRDAGASDELLERLEAQRRLSDAVRGLPEPYRSVVLWRHYEGLTPAEIARRTGTTAATVRSQLARAHGRLRARLAHDHAEGPDGGPGIHGLLVLAAGADGGHLGRSIAPLLAMKTSTKLSLAAAAATLTVAAAVGPRLLRDAQLSPAGMLAAPQRAALAPAEDARADTSMLAPDQGPASATRDVAPRGPDDLPAPVQAPPAAAAPSVSQVRARLVTDGGLPLPGGTLRTVYADGRPRGEGHVARAEPDGRVALALEDGAMRAFQGTVYPMVFEAAAPERATAFVVASPAWHGETDLGEVTLAPGASLAGAAVDPAGHPVAGARVYAGEAFLTLDLEALRRSGPPADVPRPRADSAADGRFLLAGVCAGPTRLFAHAEGRLWAVTEPFEVRAGGVQDVGLVVLEPVPAAERITGLVLRPDGSPAAAAEVAYDGGSGRDEGVARADGDGRFVVVARAEGPYELLARDPRGELGLAAIRSARAGEEVELRLTERRVVAVTVTEPDGSPVADAALMPLLTAGPSYFANGGRPLPGAAWIRTDADGRAEVPVPAESFTISGSREGYRPRRLGPFEPTSAPASATLVLDPEPRVTGRVLHAGAPVPGALVTVGQRLDGFVPREMGFPLRFFANQSQRIETDAEGRFACPFDVGWTEITVLARSAAHATGELELRVAPGQGAEDVVVELARGGSVTGVVLPPPGRSAEGLVVVASRGDGHPVWTRADADGRYRLERLTPGPWHVEGRESEPAREVLSVAQRPEDADFAWNVDVVDGVEARFDVDMRARGEVELLGRFLVDGAPPPAGWTVELVPPREEIQREATPAAALDAEGRFALTARAGRRELRLLGVLEGGARVEVLREVTVAGPRHDWEGALATGALDEPVEAGVAEVRLVRGHFYQGDREVTLVPVAEGAARARVPVGTSSMQREVHDPAFGGGWSNLATVTVR